MKALTFQSPGIISYDTVPDPTPETPADVIVQIQQSAICGSDLHIYHGREQGIDPGTIMGHEFLGTIVESGPSVHKFKIGDQVVSPFTTNCGHCYFCRQGLTCRCQQGQLFGWVEGGHGLQGAQAELIRVPHADVTLMKVPPDLDPSHALLLGDILPTGYFVADNGDIQPGSSCAVIGCGPVGLAAIIAARHLGADPIFALDCIDERLALAASLGAKPLHFKKESPQEIIFQATDGRGVDAVLEVVGNEAATLSAVTLVRIGGTVSVAGVHNELHFPFSPGLFYDKNLTYRSGRCPARHYMEQLIPLVGEWSEDLDRIISHRWPLSKGVQGYQIFTEKQEHCTKVLLKP